MIELMLHDIGELQRLADDLATSTGGLPRDTYEADCDQFLDRLDTSIHGGTFENEDYLGAKLTEIRSYLRNLLRPTHADTDLAVYQSLAHNALNALYRNLRSPVDMNADDQLLE